MSLLSSGGGGGDLPAGYTVYDWIKSDGAASISSGVILDTDYKIEVVYVLTENQNDITLVSARSHTNRWMNLGVRRYYGPHNYSPNLYFWPNYYYLNIGADSNFGTRYTIALDANRSRFIVSCGQVSSEHQIDVITGTEAIIVDTCKQPVYSIKIWKSGALVGDFIPCTNPNNEAGVYDRVREIFLGNSASSGTLTVGNDA